MEYIYRDEEGKLWWITSPAGSLFPWPKKSGMIEALSPVNEIDSFIYTYLVRTWMIFGLAAIVWFLTAISIFFTAISVLKKEFSESQ